MNRGRDWQYIRHIDVNTPYIQKPSLGNRPPSKQQSHELSVEASTNNFEFYAETIRPIHEDRFDSCLTEIKQVFEEYDYLNPSFSLSSESSESGPTSFFYEDDESDGVNFMTIEGDNLTKDEIYESIRRFVTELEECGYID